MAPDPFRIYLHAARLGGLALGLALLELGLCKDRIFQIGVRAAEARLRLFALRANVDRLTDRLYGIRSRRRPRCTTGIAHMALRLQDRWGLTDTRIAHIVGVTARTIKRWKRLRAADRLILGPTEPPVPPLRRFSDSTRVLIRSLAAAGCAGKGTLSLALGTVGLRVRPTAVGSIRMETAATRPAPSPRRPRQAPPPALVEEPDSQLAYSRSRDLHTRRVAQRLGEVRDAFHTAVAHRLWQLRRLGAERLHGKLADLHRDEQFLLEVRAILQARLDRIAPQRRTRYTAAQRADILAERSRLRLPVAAVAARNGIDPVTISAWNVAVDRRPGTLVRPEVPLAGFGEGVERAARDLAKPLGIPFAGLVPVLDQLCQETSIRTRAVDPSAAPPRERRRRQRVRKPGRQIRARHPNHVWTIDLTALPSLFGIYQPHLAVVLDVYSRYPVAWRLWSRQPPASEVVGLLEKALAVGKPVTLKVGHLITDQGPQFTADELEDVLRRHDIKHRLGAIGEHGSIATIERLWLTLKLALSVDDRPDLQFRDFQHRFGAALDWYARLRAHSSLGGATPHERYHGFRPACLDAVSPPRARPGVRTPDLGIEVHYALPLEERLPYLVRTAA